MTDECDFDQTLRNMLDTPPTPHKSADEPSDDRDDVVDASEEDEGEE